MYPSGYLHALTLALLFATGTACANPFVETFGNTATRQPSPYVPQFTAAGAVSFYRFANPTGSPVERRVDDGTYTVINPSQIIPTGGGTWWANEATGPAASIQDHTGDAGAVLVLNAGNTENALYRRIVTLDGGKTYTFTVWRFIVAGPTSLTLELREPDDTQRLAESATFITAGAFQAGQWVPLTWTFKVDACTTRQYAVALRNNSPVVSGNDLFFDDISVQENAGAASVPVPCSTTSVPTVTASDDGGTTRPGQPVGINLVTNDSSSSPSNATLGQPAPSGATAQNGSVVFNGDGTATYTPNPGFVGTDTFNYTICTVAAQTNPTPSCANATVTINVTAALSAPGGTSSIPTLSEWGLIIMSSLIAMFGIARTRRRR